MASDINPDVFDEVSTGRYKVVDKNHEKFFQEAYGDKLGRFVKKCGKEFVVRKPIRNMVDFLPFNLKTDLLDNPNPESEVFLRAPYNAIVCRHTLVYLQRRLASEVLRKFYGLMKDSGMLCVGAADNLEPEFVARQGLFKQLCAYLFTKAA